MEPLEQQLILERDIKQLQQDNSSLEDKNARLKQESLSVLDLIEKQKKTLKGLEERSLKVMDTLRDEKISWETQKREEQASLESKQLEANKIMNRENYIKVQEKEFLKRKSEVELKAQATAEKEASFVQRETLVKDLEKQADKHWDEAQKVNGYSKQALETLKKTIIEEVNKWEV